MDIHTFAGNPIRLFLDNGLLVTICSFRGSLDRFSRSENIYNVIEQV